MFTGKISQNSICLTSFKNSNLRTLRVISKLSVFLVAVILMNIKPGHNSWIVKSIRKTELMEIILSFNMSSFSALWTLHAYERDVFPQDKLHVGQTRSHHNLNRDVWLSLLLASSSASMENSPPKFIMLTLAPRRTRLWLVDRWLYSPKLCEVDIHQST